MDVDKLEVEINIQKLLFGFSARLVGPIESRQTGNPTRTLPNAKQMHQMCSSWTQPEHQSTRQI